MSESLPDAWRLAARRSVRRSFSVHCLFLISSDFMLFSPAGRDDADDFFAIDVLPISVDNQQNGRSLRLEANFPEGMPPLFSRFVDAMRADETVFVFEDERRQLEGDAAMLALVSPIFGFVPFVAHNVYTYRTTPNGLSTRVKRGSKRGRSYMNYEDKDLTTAIDLNARKTVAK